MKKFFDIYSNAAIRAISSVLAFLTILIATKIFNHNQLASYLYILSISGLLSVASLFGSNTLILRYIPNAMENACFSNISKLRSIFIPVIMSPFFSLLGCWIIITWFDQGGLAKQIHIGMFVLLCYSTSISILLNSVVIALNRQIASSLIDLMNKGVVFLGHLVAMYAFEKINLNGVIYIYIYSNFIFSFVTLFLFGVRLYKILFSIKNKDWFSIRHFKEAISIWPSQFFDLGLRQAPLITLNSLGMISEVAIFGLVMRIFNIFSIITTPLNQYIAPRLAVTINKEPNHFIPVYRLGRLAMVFVIVPAYLFFVIFSDYLLTYFFGAIQIEYGYLGLILLLTVQLFYALTGPAGMALIMSGNGFQFTLITFVFYGIGYLLCPFIIENYKYMGSCMVVALPMMFSCIVSYVFLVINKKVVL